jgi:hypothetical protein
MDMFWLMIVTLAVIVVGVPVVLGIALEMYKRHMAYKERRLELTADKTAEKAAQYAAHVERLEQRMRVLERIATDKGVHLADEIEDLRRDPEAAKLPNEELN